MDVLESGDIYFLFRPRVNTDEPRGLRDVQRFFVILRPRERRLYRQSSKNFHVTRLPSMEEMLVSRNR